jgi:hypothetical protein
MDLSEKFEFQIANIIHKQIMEHQLTLDAYNGENVFLIKVVVKYELKIAHLENLSSIYP